MSIKLFVAGNPVPQPRHRVGNGRAYLKASEPVHAYKDELRLRARSAVSSSARIIGPVAVSVVFAFARPKSYPRSLSASWYPVKPDTDNLEKSVLDALKGIVYADDSQIVRFSAIKIVADSDERIAPGVYVRVSQCDESAEALADAELAHF